MKHYWKTKSKVSNCPWFNGVASLGPWQWSQGLEHLSAHSCSHSPAGSCFICTIKHQIRKPCCKRKKFNWMKKENYNTFWWYQGPCFPWPKSPASDLQSLEEASPLHLPSTVSSQCSPLHHPIKTQQETTINYKTRGAWWSTDQIQTFIQEKTEKQESKPLSAWKQCQVYQELQYQFRHRTSSWCRALWTLSMESELQKEKKRKPRSNLISSINLQL